MSILVLDLLFLIIGLIGLVWGANLFVSGSASVAKHIGMTPMMIGLTVVAFGTSAPEMIVSADAALNGIPAMGVGNAIGSNIANIGLVLGVTALIATIPVNAGLMRLEIPLLLAVTVLAAVCLWDYRLTYIEGWILLGSTIPVSVILIRHARNTNKQSKTLGETAISVENDVEIPDLSVWLVLGLTALLGFADLLVSSASNLAEYMGVSPMVIGLTIVALGTSLPELAASVTSALKGHHEIAIGNIVGSNILNLLAVMALPGIIASTSLEPSVISRDLFTMALLTLALVIIMWVKTRIHNTSQGIGRVIGLLFIAAYIAYYAVIFINNS
jgi:cation:H+ antiporter